MSENSETSTPSKQAPVDLTDAQEAAPQQLPVIALRDTVMFPNVRAPVLAGRPKTVGAIKQAMEQEGRQIFVVAQKRPETEDPGADDLYRFGTICRIQDVERGGQGYQVVLHGQSRGKVIRYLTGEEMLTAEVEEVADAPITGEDEKQACKALEREVRDQMMEASRHRGVPERLVKSILAHASGPGELSHLAAFYLDEPETQEKQQLLVQREVRKRLRQVLGYLQNEIGMLEAQETIRGKVKEEVGEKQREYYLRQQLKAIREELGEEAQGDVAELRERLEALELPDEARKEVDKELNRLEQLPEQSPHYGMVRSYLETVSELPWNERDETAISLDRSQQILDEDHFGLDEVKDRVIDYLAVCKLRGGRPQPSAEDMDTGEGSLHDDRMGSVLVFSGPPGTGKTSVAKSIARALDREYVRVALGGVRDEADIRGHRRTYVGAMPGRIIEGLKRAETKNPVFLLDELDKLGASFQGDPSAALMEVLDPEQNTEFVDHYLGVPFDLSEILFVGTANVLEGIPGPLRDRLEVIEFRGYTEREKLEIAKQYLLPRQIRENGLENDDIEVDEEVIEEIITRYTREAGVRQLERELGTLCRKVAREKALQEEKNSFHPPFRIDGELRDLLGKPKARDEEKLEKDTVGVSTGMYYTPAGGDIMLVEASVFRGNEDFVLTGQLGDIMQESARAALTYTRSHAAELGISEERLQDHEIHIHVPAGAVQKEGPSAGLALTASLVSALTEKPVRANVAMSGEITLTGRVLPVGGIEEKVLGAWRSGIREIILPEENEKDLDDLPDEVQEECMFHIVSQVGEMLELTIPGLAAHQQD